MSEQPKGPYGPKGPVVIDLDTPVEALDPSVAPQVPDEAEIDGTAMQSVARLASRKPSRLWRWFWTILVSLIGFVASVAAWDFVAGLIARSPVLGAVATVLVAAFLVVLLVLALGELAAFSRLRRVDSLQKAAQQALDDHDLAAARDVTDKVLRFYSSREDTRWGRDRLSSRREEVLDADGLIGAAEVEVLATLDKTAEREVEAAVRQVATVTALVPLALADMIAALSANLRMIRRIAEIYGGRAGGLSSWRLTRTVLTHLVATGAVAVGDDLIGTVAGGGALSKVSRRFGEGVINGALTARVGVAAIEVCRPLPYVVSTPPSVSKLVRRALTGLFSKM